MTNNKYRHIPYEVEAMRVLKEDLADIISWLGDDFAEMHNQSSFSIGDRIITVPERNATLGLLSIIVTYRSPTDSSQVLYNVVFNGDWIVREKGQVYAIYTDSEFIQQFESSEDDHTFLSMDDIETVEGDFKEAPVETPAVEDKEELGSMDINDLLGMVEGTDVSPADGEEDT